LAFNFNNDPFSPPGQTPGTTLSSAPVQADDTAAVDVPAAAAAANAPASLGFTRFNSCRWQQPAEDGNTAFCTHREVKPYAGTTGFDPDAWCGECQYYKLRRAPKKRNPSDDYSY
jgi:hypothetical protein